MVEVNWSEQALNDVTAIAEYIALDSATYARLQTNLFFDRAEILAFQPYAGREVPELNKPEIRELIIGNYRMIYSVVSDLRIDILTVHHSRRLLSNNPAMNEPK